MQAAEEDVPDISTTPRSPAPSRMLRFLGSWRQPVHRDGVALVSSSALSSLVGLLYWVVAARLFPPAEVGVGSALVSTLMLLGRAAIYRDR